jgi:hypothetical protein
MEESAMANARLRTRPVGKKAAPTRRGAREAAKEPAPTPRGAQEAAKNTAPTPEEIRAYAREVAEDVVEAAQDVVAERPGGRALLERRDIREIDPDDQQLQRDIFDVLVPVVGNVLLSVLSAIKTQRRDAGDPETPDVEPQVRDFAAILADLLPELLDLVPDIIDVISGERDVPVTDEETTERWIWPLVTVLAPWVLDQVSGLVSEIAGDRDLEAPPNADWDPGVIPTPSPVRGEFGARFGSQAIGGLFSGIIQVLPDVFALLTGGQSRDIALNWVNFQGQRFPDGDVIQLEETDLGDPNVIEFELHQPWNTWWKGLQVYIGDSLVQETYVQDSRRDSETLHFEVDQLAGAGRVKLLKAKIFGVHTGIYDVYELEEKAGRRLALYWYDD